MFGRATITLGIGPHSSSFYLKKSNVHSCQSVERDLDTSFNHARFGHVPMLDEDKPAHRALGRQINTSLGPLPDRSWKRATWSPKKQMDGSVSISQQPPARWSMETRRLSGSLLGDATVPADDETTTTTTTIVPPYKPVRNNCVLYSIVNQEATQQPLKLISTCRSPM